MLFDWIKSRMKRVRGRVAEMPTSSPGPETLSTFRGTPFESYAKQIREQAFQEALSALAARSTGRRLQPAASSQLAMSTALL